MNEYYNKIKDKYYQVKEILSDKKKERKAQRDREKARKAKNVVNIRTVNAQIQQNAFKIDQQGRTLNDIGAMVEMLLNCKLVQVDHMNETRERAERVQNINERAQKIAHAKLKKLQAESSEPITQAVYMPIMEQARKQAELELYPDTKPGEPTALPNDVVEESKKKFEAAKKARLESLEKESQKETEVVDHIIPKDVKEKDST